MTQPKQILVIDDDPLFRAQIKKAATERGISVTVCSSFKELDEMAEPKLFDVAIVDYYLDNLKSYLKGVDIAEAMQPTPVVLISSSSHPLDDNEPFPSSVRRFVQKTIGINAILNTALSTSIKTSPTFKSFRGGQEVGGST